MCGAERRGEPMLIAKKKKIETVCAHNGTNGKRISVVRIEKPRSRWQSATESPPPVALRMVFGWPLNAFASRRLRWRFLYKLNRSTANQYQFQLITKTTNLLKFLSCFNETKNQNQFQHEIFSRCRFLRCCCRSFGEFKAVWVFLVALIQVRGVVLWLIKRLIVSQTGRHRTAKGDCEEKFPEVHRRDQSCTRSCWEVEGWWHQWQQWCHQGRCRSSPLISRRSDLPMIHHNHNNLFLFPSRASPPASSANPVSSTPAVISMKRPSLRNWAKAPPKSKSQRSSNSSPLAYNKLVPTRPMLPSTPTVATLRTRLSKSRKSMK